MKRILVLLLAVGMGIYIGAKVRVGNQNVYTIRADKHWELETAARFYGARIQKDRAGNYSLQINEYARVRGIAYESEVPSLNPRVDPMNTAANKLGGSAGDMNQLTKHQQQAIVEMHEYIQSHLPQNKTTSVSITGESKTVYPT